MYDECDYPNCEKDLAEWQPKSGAKLCEDHSDQFDEMVENDDVSGLVSFGMEILAERAGLDIG